MALDYVRPSVMRRVVPFVGLLATLQLGLARDTNAQSCIVTTPIGAGTDRGTAVAIQPDGKIVLAGYYAAATDDFALVRYNPDFTLDMSFGTGGIVTTPIGSGEDRAEAIALQSDGKIVVAGHADIGGNHDFAVVRYNLDGSLDTTFNPGGLFPPGVAGMITTAITGNADEVEGVAIQPDGKIVAAGFATPGNMDVAVARYNPNGSLDTANFNSPFGYFVSGGPTDDVANAVVLQPNGQIVVAGWATVANDDFLVARLNADGTQDLGFGNVLINFPTNNRDRATALFLQPDDKIVVTGEARNAGFGKFGAARRNFDGTVDASFGPGGTVTTSFSGGHDIPFGAVLQPTDQHIVLGGYANWFGAGMSADWALLRYDDLGNPDNSFDFDSKVQTDIAADNDFMDSLALQPDGRIVAAGFSAAAGNENFALVRYLSNGSIDNSCVRKNFRSIGTNGGILYSVGNASIVAGSNTVTFGAGASLPLSTAVPAVGTGDVLILNPGAGQEIFHIDARLTATRVTVQVGAMASHTNVPYEIRRAHTTLQGWESAREGLLAAENRREYGVAYNDGPFQPPYVSTNSAVVFESSTTDPDRYMALIVADGQRHNGTAGTGVLVDGQFDAASKFGINVKDDYVHVDGLEIARFRPIPTDAGFAAVVVEAVGADFQNIIIHDFRDASVSGDGMRVSTAAGGWSFTVRNSIIYNGDRTGIRADQGTSTVDVDNCTIYDMEQVGVGLGTGGGTVNVTNTISLRNPVTLVGTSAFSAGSGTLNQLNTISWDGTGTLTGKTATATPTASADFVVFNNLTVIDLHLKASTVNDAVDTGMDLSGSYCCDIDGASRPLPWDIGADELGVTTAVSLSKLAADGLDAAVRVSWATSSELDNLGFHVYRSRFADGPYQRITEHVIPGLGSSPVGASYLFRDSGLMNGVTYYYRLQDVDTRGGSQLHGPVFATPSLAAGLIRPPVQAPALITYGDATATSLKVRRLGENDLVVELLTGGFYAEPLEDGSVGLTIPDFAELSELGQPAMPVMRTWVETRAGRKVELVSVTVDGIESFTNLVPRRAAGMETVASPGGTVRARRRGSDALTRPGNRNSPAFRAEGLYPSEPARLLSVAFQGDVKKALLELAPLRWDGSTGRLSLSRRIEVRLSLEAPEPAESSIAGSRGRRVARRGARRTDGNVVTRLVTRERGLYAVTFEELRRWTGLATDEVRLSRQGVPVAFHVEPDARWFGPRSTLLFVSGGSAANPYGDEAVYELELGTAGEVMEETSAAPPNGTGAPASHYWQRLEREESRYHQAALVEASDRWFWDLIFAPTARDYPFRVDSLATVPEASSLRVSLQGGTDFPAAPDHHVRVFLNGSPVGEASWNGKTAFTIEAEVPPRILRDGENVLRIESPGDTEAPYSMVFLDSFALDYPRRALALNGTLEGEWKQFGEARVLDVDARAGVHLLDVSDDHPRWLVNGESSDDGDFRFRAEPGRRYLVVSHASVLRPQVIRVAASRLKNAGHGADYLVIGPSRFLQAAEPLLKLRRSQGLRVQAVSIEAIYSEFGFGEETPEAIRDFVAYAYHEWQAPSVRYVLLLGDASFDFKDHLQTGARNHVPTWSTKTSYLWTASDLAFAAVNGEDPLPDVAIGRLPAANVDEARVMAEKIVTWEKGGQTLGGAVVLVADDADDAGDFEADAEELASSILATRLPRRIFLGELGISATRRGVVDAFDEGASLVSYLGHGGIHLWANENILMSTDVPAFAPQTAQPLVLTMNCLNGYFHFPYFDALAEALVKQEGGGAIAAFSPSGLSLNEPAHRYHREFLRALYEGGHERLGDVVFAAQEAYAETGALPELLSIYHLFGDPALKIR